MEGNRQWVRKEEKNNLRVEKEGENKRKTTAFQVFLLLCIFLEFFLSLD